MNIYTMYIQYKFNILLLFSFGTNYFLLDQLRIKFRFAFIYSFFSALPLFALIVVSELDYFPNCNVK